MSETEVITALTIKRDSLHREIIALRKQLKAINATMRVFKADAASKEPGRMSWSVFPKRELSRRLMDALRRSNRPMTAIDLATDILRDRPNLSDPHAIADVSKRLRPFMRTLIARRIVEWNGDKRAPVWWMAVSGDRD